MEERKAGYRVDLPGENKSHKHINEQAIVNPGETINIILSLLLLIYWVVLLG